MATPTDQELQLLKSGDLDVDREAEPSCLIARSWPASEGTW